MSERTKRFMDVTVATVGLALFAPVIVAIAVAIRVQSPGPAILRQPRIGRGGQHFTCYKLRTMNADVEDRPSHEIPPTVITTIGHWLRRSKLDELPQLFNVLRGDMSLVGPRPCLPIQHELIAARSSLGILELRPGITGLAQIMSLDMSVPRRLARVDARYLARRSTALDLRILGATMRQVAFRSRWKYDCHRRVPPPRYSSQSLGQEKARGILK